MKDFTYIVQLEATAKTKVGREASFLVTESFTNTIEEQHDGYATGKILNQDTNGDLNRNSIYDMMKEKVDLHCSIENLITSTVVVLSYTVSSEDPDIVLYFDSERPSERTVDRLANLYAFLYQNSGTVDAPVNALAEEKDGGIGLTWELGTHHHGVRIYDEQKVLITSLKRDTKSWVHYENVVQGKLYVYYITSYRGTTESDFVRTFVKAQSKSPNPIENENKSDVFQESGQIRSFQSGIGDGADLKVSVDGSNGSESFTYTMQLRGYEHVDGAEVAHYGPIISGRGTQKVFNKEVLELKEEILNPALDPSIEDKVLMDWSVLLLSNNPNVELTVSKSPNIEGEERRYLPFMLKAIVKNPTQTPWNPLVNTGYYYINQKERYLYNQVHVEGRPDEGEDFARLSFIYTIKATIQNGLLSREISKVFVAKVDSSQKIIRVDERSISEMMEEELAREGFIVGVHTVTSYELSTLSEYPVTLTARSYIDHSIIYSAEESGAGYPYAQTDSTVVDYIYNTSKVFVDSEQSAIIHPSPKQGAPIIIEKDEKQTFKQVFFYDEYGVASIFNVEYQKVNESGEVFLTYGTIDPNSIEVGVRDKGEWVDSKAFKLHNSKLILGDQLGSTEVRVKYALTNSFCVDYNYGNQGEFAKITFHDIQFRTDEERYVKVYCETGEDSFYKAEEVELNPLKTTAHTGFLYISEEERILSKITLSTPNSSLYANSKESIRMRAYALDASGDPVGNVTLEIHTDAGNIQVTSLETNIDGMIEFDFLAPEKPGEVRITVSSAEYDKEGHADIDVIPYGRKGRMFLKTSRATVFPGDSAAIVTAYVYGPDQEPLEGAEVLFEVTSGDIEHPVGITDINGQFQTEVYAVNIPKTGIIEVSVKYEEGGLDSKTVLRIEGYRYYHPDLLIRGNNLLDLYDLVEARKNLGINMSEHTPTNPLMNDLWFDKKDMLYFVQRYQLRDILDRQAGRVSLGLHTNTEMPTSAWPNDMWFDEENDAPQEEGED